MQGKTAVITGASSGIGLETARALAGKGARVVMVVRSEHRTPDVEGVTGEYFTKCKVKTPSSKARDDASARRLWELSEKLCGVTWS